LNQFFCALSNSIYKLWDFQEVRWIHNAEHLNRGARWPRPYRNLIECRLTGGRRVYSEENFHCWNHTALTR